MPIIHHRILLGVLVVQQKAIRRFDENEEAFMVTMSAQLAGVIAHAEATGSIKKLSDHEKGESDRKFEGVSGCIGVAIGPAVVMTPLADLDGVPERKTEDIKEEVASDIKRLLDKANRTVFKTIRDSNFYIAASESLTDAIISGCGAIGMYETESEIEFIGIPTYQLYFLDDYKGELDTVFRQHQCTAQFLFETYKL